MSSPGLAVVTGASAGIGREFCEQLAARGYDLLVVARSAPRLETLRRELEGRHRIGVEVVAADLAREESVTGLVGRLRDEPRLALLVNNAGFGSYGTLAAAEPAVQEAMLRVHVLAPMRLTQAALPGMLRRGRGAVVNVASVAAFVFSAGNVNYCATKAYLTTFSQGLAVELARTGVRVQALCPGFTRSEFHDRAAWDIADIPGFMWLSAERVVRDSLRALDRGGPVICVPGALYKGIVRLLPFVPRWAIAAVTDRRRRVRAVT